MEKYLSKTTVGWAAIGVGVLTALTPAWAATTAAGAACTLGFGIATAYFGVLGLLVRNPTPTHWGLVVVGVSLFIAPWLAGFAGDGAAWTASSVSRVRENRTHGLKGGWGNGSALRTPRP